MPPFTTPTASTDEDEDADLRVLHSAKEHPLVLAAGALAAEGREDGDDDDVNGDNDDALDIELLEDALEEDVLSNDVGMKQSSLFMIDDDDDDTFGASTSEPPSADALQTGGLSLDALDDFAAIHCQMAADEQLARTLQEEENEKSTAKAELKPRVVNLFANSWLGEPVSPWDVKSNYTRVVDADEQLARTLQEEENQKSTVKSKPRVVNLLSDSWLGEPVSPWDIKSNYTRVVKATPTQGLGSDLASSIASVGNELASSVKGWGSGILGSMTAVLGEDPQSQVTGRPPAKSLSGKYPNAI